ncbi:anti-sigma factor [Paeniglutamicibacter cryotolerans]|uniref:Anti-sigma K factor RskA C-terminal domain-containing protein n=1 Tax=Paeniglutamicibacter cryotolerans TaxID=670079 RepID=A0A839QJ27_9MICC|nr:anti-sigma factor [Paeniglutamicibacter cryotolerans]MBB2995840.1 hypothetical protein [Paeniglutamicibacter cryotolerans]
MRHLDDAELASIALSGLASLEPESRRHIDTCPDCSVEAAAFSSVGSVARSQDFLDEPPAELWERITGELGVELSPQMLETSHANGVSSATTTGLFPRVVLPKTTPDDALAPTQDNHPAPEQRQATPEHSPDAGRPIRGLRPRRGRRAGNRNRSRAWIATAAVASFVLGAAVAVGVGQWVGRDRIEVVEQASLQPLPGWDASGTARVEDTAGKLQLVVDLPDNPVSGFREVWLLDLAGKTPGLLSVGTLNGDQGVFDLPPGVDLTKYNVVDVSHEPFDGNPAHSSDSIVRGELGSVS